MGMLPTLALTNLHSVIGPVTKRFAGAITQDPTGQDLLSLTGARIQVINTDSSLDVHA